MFKYLGFIQVCLIYILTKGTPNVLLMATFHTIKSKNDYKRMHKRHLATVFKDMKTGFNRCMENI